MSEKIINKIFNEKRRIYLSECDAALEYFKNKVKELHENLYKVVSN